jgi:hypothetical protein
MTDDERKEKVLARLTSQLTNLNALHVRLVVRETDYDILTAVADEGNRQDIMDAWPRPVRFDEPYDLETNEDIFIWMSMKELGVELETFRPGASDVQANYRAAHRNLKARQRIEFILRAIEDAVIALEPSMSS